MVFVRWPDLSVGFVATSMAKRDKTTAETVYGSIEKQPLLRMRLTRCNGLESPTQGYGGPGGSDRSGLHNPIIAHIPLLPPPVEGESRLNPGGVD